jgi:hypothetical protein
MTTETTNERPIEPTRSEPAASDADRPKSTPVTAGPGSTTTSPSSASRPDHANAWSGPVDRLVVGEMPRDAINLNVAGRRLVGPVQGFGRLWQKTYRVGLQGSQASPEEVIRTWKAEFPTFWPKGNRFYGPLTGIAPGDVAVLNLSMPGGQVLSTGVVVIFADDESFSFMTPEGHMFAALITFSAERSAADSTEVLIQILLRANDPFWELSMGLGGHKVENEFWLATLHNLAARFGVDATATQEQVCVDRRRQWRNARNIRQNAAIRSAIWMLTHPQRLLRRGR